MEGRLEWTRVIAMGDPLAQGLCDVADGVLRAAQTAACVPDKDDERMQPLEIAGDLVERAPTRVVAQARDVTPRANAA